MNITKTLFIKLVLFFMMLSPWAMADDTTSDIDAGVELRNATSDGNIEKVKELLQKKVDVDAANEFGITPLMLAAEANHIEIAALLMANGANVNARSRDGLTALIYAAEEGNAEISAMLVEMGANVHDRTHKGWKDLMIAA